MRSILPWTLAVLISCGSGVDNIRQSASPDYQGCSGYTGTSWALCIDSQIRQLEVIHNAPVKLEIIDIDQEMCSAHASVTYQVCFADLCKRYIKQEDRPDLCYQTARIGFWILLGAAGGGAAAAGN